MTHFLAPLFLLAATFASFPGLAQPTLPDDFYAIRPATVDCVVHAAWKQGVPANVLLALATIEGGKNGQFVDNANGSQDIGHFQINSIHWKPGGHFASQPSIRKQDVAWRGCYNAELAAWLLKQHINASTGQDFWIRAANYHSRTPEHNERYRRKLIPLAARWANWLEQRYADWLSSRQ